MTEVEFWRVVNIVRAVGHLEEWTPPVGFYDSGPRRAMLNTRMPTLASTRRVQQPRTGPAMLNRESVAVQRAKPTRRLAGTELASAVGPPDAEPPEQF